MIVIPVKVAAHALLLGALAFPTLVLAVDSEDVRRQFETLGVSGSAINIHGVRNIPALVDLYSERGYQPLWFANGPLTPMHAALIAEVEASGGHGFRSGRYHLEALTRQDLPDALLEILYSDALLSQAHDRFTGVLDSTDDEWFIQREPLDTVAFLRSLAEERSNIRPALHALWPRHQEYWALVGKRAALVAQEDAYTVAVPTGPLLRLGDSGPRIHLLQQRLLGPGEYSGVFDLKLNEAVAEFQRSAGLEADGIVGEATLEMLNANRFSWIDQLDANLERWRWLPREIPSTYISINIAAFRLRVIEDGVPELGMDVIVGRPFRQTPIFTETLKYLVFFPYWNVPYSIATKDKLPLLRTDPEALAQAGYEVQLRGETAFQAVNQVEWSTIKPGEFTLRQRPGQKNALGAVKFMLPNPYSVYLHDTPDKALFSKTERTFSSGCIRLAEPQKLADWVLNYDHNKYLADLDRLLASGPSTTAYLSRPIPVYLVYFTAFQEGDGVVFRRDIYERDERIVRALRSAGDPV
tara:strand:+ start:224317 stop:225891 length:1575 start_codon:yes stop_codon:yes gene_type:complete